MDHEVKLWNIDKEAYVFRGLRGTPSRNLLVKGEDNNEIFTRHYLHLAHYFKLNLKMAKALSNGESQKLSPQS